MRIAVTGGAGFIGTRLVQALLARGDEVVVIDVVPGASAETVIASVLDRAALESAFAGSDAVVHLAGFVRAGIRKDPIAGATLQLQGTLEVLEACVAAGVPRLAFASSFYVYDGLPGDAVVDEACALDVQNMELFGAVKLMGEVLCRQWAARSGLGVVCLRFGPAYGGGGSSAIDEFVEASVSNRPVVVWGDGSRRNQYTHVHDLVAGTLASLEYPGETFNLVAPEQWSMRELTEMMAREHGFCSSFDPTHAEAPQLPYISSERAIGQLGWAPTTLTDGVRAMFGELSAPL